MNGDLSCFSAGESPNRPAGKSARGPKQPKNQRRNGKKTAMFLPRPFVLIGVLADGA
jgi:PilZ domain